MFLELGVLLLIAVIVTIVMRYLKLPMIMAYIITGIIVGPYALNAINSHDLLESLSHVGVALLLFIIGLGLHPKMVREVGKAAVVIGTIQVVGITALGYIVGRMFGFEPLPAAYIAVACSFSSTIIIMKLLEGKREMGRFYGKMTLGVMLVQDLIASAVLIGVTAMSNGSTAESALWGMILKAFLFALVFYLISRYILPRVSKLLVQSQELLFLFSVAWALGAAMIASEIGLTMEIGGLFAGIIFASLPYAKLMSTKMIPLHDLLLAIFFILLGAQMNLADIPSALLPAIVLSALIIIGNPLIIMIVMRFLGYRKRTNFRAALATAQAGEFALILIILGERAGYLSSYAITIVTLVTLITVACSSYMIIYAEALYKRLERLLKPFEKQKVRRERRLETSAEVVLLGYKESLFDPSGNWRLASISNNYLVVDRRPSTVELMQSRDIRCEYGDVRDVDFLDELYLEKTKLVVSAIQDKEVNKLFIDHFRNQGLTPLVVVYCKTGADAIELYEAGADYVEVLENASAKQVARLVRKNGLAKMPYNEERQQHIARLREQAAQQAG